MSRKKKSRSGEKNAEKKRRAAEFDAALFRMENDLLALVDERGALSRSEIITELADHAGRTSLKKCLSGLIRDGWIVEKNGTCSLHPKSPLVRGVLTRNIKGFGFVAVFGTEKKRNDDPFIPKTEMHGAIHGDSVLIRPLPFSRRRPEFTILRVVEAAPDILCGILREKRGEYLVTPDDRRIPFKVRLAADQLGKAAPGEVVRVQFTRHGDSHTRPGRLLAVLGSPALIDTQMKLVIDRFDLPTEFSKAARRRAENRTISSSEYQRRVDLRTTSHITIDGAEAKDFDDAICVENHRKNIRLYVSIADVSHYVTPGTALDREAYQRGTSVYFPGRVIPMLPEKLADDLCSLIPGEDRLTMTAELEFTRAGKMVTKRFYRSVIRSCHRFTYSRVAELLQGADAEDTDEAARVPMLITAQALARQLGKLRFARGAIDFNLREPRYLLDDNGGVADVRIARRTEAHRLIEEFMLIANEAAATFLCSRVSPPLLRIHEQPDNKKIKEFQEIAARLGIRLPKYSRDPAWFSSVLRDVKGRRREYIVNTLLLRSLSQARYSPLQAGHFGLASTAYTHFTSPIRRYPDLIVHRMLNAALDAGNQKTRKKRFAPASTADAAEFLSARERNAIDAERDMNDRLKIAWMKDRIGEEFTAVISGVRENGLFVELIDSGVSGAVPVDLLGADAFFYDADHMRLCGEISGRKFQLGDIIEVVLVSISSSRRQLTFAPLQEQP